MTALPPQLGELEISSRTAGGHAVVAAAGVLDVYTAPRLRQHLAALVDSRPELLVLDLTGMEFVDSTGIGVIVGTQMALWAQGGALGLRGVSDPLLRVLELTGLTRFLEIDLT